MCYLRKEKIVVHASLRNDIIGVESMAKREEQNKEDIDFEIQLFESILKERPDFTEVMMALGDLYTKKGLNEKGLRIDQKLFHLRPEDPIVLYNLACSYSLTNQIEEALKIIKLAIEFGYDDMEYLLSDRDLDNLKKDQQFQKFWVELKGIRDSDLKGARE